MRLVHILLLYMPNTTGVMPMYDTHGKIIANYAAHSPLHLMSVAKFVYATINMKFEFVPGILRRSIAQNNANLSKNAKQGLAQWRDNRQAIYEVVYGTTSDIDKLLYVASLHGLGIVKAGFLLQLALHEPGQRYACLDRRNITHFGLDDKRYKTQPQNLIKRRELIEEYLQLCGFLGGSAGLWNFWCMQLSHDRPKHFPTPESVSALHVKCILPGMLDT